MTDGTARWKHALHREGRGARLACLAMRDEGADRQSVTEEQRRQAGCLAPSRFAVRMGVAVCEEPFRRARLAADRSGRARSGRSHRWRTSAGATRLDDRVLRRLAEAGRAGNRSRGGAAPRCGRRRVWDRHRRCPCQSHRTTRCPTSTRWTTSRPSTGTTGSAPTAPRGAIRSPRCARALAAQNLPDAPHRRRDARRPPGCATPASSSAASVPAPPSGVTFMTLEDETGFVNVVLWQRVFDDHAVLARNGVVPRGEREAAVRIGGSSTSWPTRSGRRRFPARPPTAGSRDFH